MTLALDAKGRLKQRERDVAKTLCDFLRSEGWRVIRLQTGVFRGITGGRPRWIGEKGQPDYLAMRATNPSGYSSPMARCFFLETKRYGANLRKDQKNWHVVAQDDGFLVCTARSLDELKTWMAANRLRA